MITCVPSQSVSTDKSMDTAMVVWDDPKALDSSGKASHVICDPPSGTNFPIGQTNITCEAVDNSGNRATCTFQVNVTGKWYQITWNKFRCSVYVGLKYI